MIRPSPGAEPGPWQEVAEGVYVCVAEPATVNLGLIVGSHSALVVDTGSSPAQGRLLRKRVADVTSLPLAGAVATHWHYDHAFGLAGFGDLTTYAHESVRERLLGPLAAAAADDLRVDPGDLSMPTRELVVATAVELGARRVELAHLGRGHTDGDLVVVVPDADVVFTGDLIETADAPWFGADSYPHEWAASLDSVIGVMTGKTVAVPGHGPPANREFVFGQRGRIAAVSGEIQRLKEAGVALSAALETGSWPFPAEHVSDGIEPGYRQLRAAGRATLPLI